MKKFIQAFRDYQEINKTVGGGYSFCWSELGNCFFYIYASKERIQQDGNFEYIC